MARMERLPKSEQVSLPAMECPTFESTPWVAPVPMSSRRVAIVNTAGLMRVGERPVAPRAPEYRVIPHNLAASEILMSHVSVNFDRSGFYQDPNCALPRDRLSELASDGVIGGISAEHYSFMGATEPAKMEPNARELARKLIGDAVDTVLLVPV